MKLRKAAPAGPPISIVSMIDVLMILLIFFMVTSTYLNLAMIPMAERPAEAASARSDAPTGETVLLRLSGDGSVHLQGRTLDLATLQREVMTRRAAHPDLTVTILPSGQARTQALATVMDALAAAGVTRLRLLSVEGGP